MNNFNFKIPQNIEFGAGCLKKLPEVLKLNNSEHVFMISDPGLKSIGLVDKVQKIVEDNNLKCTVFTDVKPNPTIAVIDEAAEQYKKSGATSIIALGGGSPMDVAKVVGVLATYGGKVVDYEGAHLVPGPIVPTIAIPTTAGTGSEVTASAVVTDEERNFKFTVFSFEMLPKFALLDPELVLGTPAHIAAACGIDAFIHAAEAYLSTNANPFSDLMAEKAMELIGKSIRRFVANRNDLEAACDMLVGSTFAGISFASARLGNVHAMSHPVSAYFHVPHGVANAIIFPTVMEYNALSDNGRYEKIYNYVRRTKQPVKAFTPDILIQELITLNEEIGIPKKLSDVGVTADLIEKMAPDTMKSANVLSNPRQSTVKDIAELYKKLI